MKGLFIVVSLWSLGFSYSALAKPQSLLRLVSVGGTVSEIICALGLCDKIVATDSSSLYPASLADLPQFGYARQLVGETLLSFRPSLIIATEASGPPRIFTLLAKAKIPLVKVSAEPGIIAAQKRIAELGKVLKRPEKAAHLIRHMDEQLQHLQARLPQAGPKPRVIFVYARGLKNVSVSGRETAAHAMIELASAINPVTSYTGYKPLTAESLIALNPDFILLTDRGLASLGGLAGLQSIPGIALTQAFKSKQIIAMDDLKLLGFGPRLGEALNELADKLYHPKVQARSQ